MTTLSLLDKINRLTAAEQQLVEQIITSFVPGSVPQNSCACHIINPAKHRILLWKHKTLPNTYILKITDQLFISSSRSDKNGEVYWKFRDVAEPEEKMVENPIVNPSETKPPVESTPLEKFHQRQTKTDQINHERNNSTSDP